MGGGRARESSGDQVRHRAQVPHVQQTQQVDRRFRAFWDLSRRYGRRHPEGAVGNGGRHTKYGDRHVDTTGSTARVGLDFGNVVILFHGSCRTDDSYKRRT